ncbi:MAG: hypothetical protein IKD79_02215, partial [Oscillospiraceae bacterium]|nr:hypothetical protein [Oscillospiraceae bacterium]
MLGELLPSPEAPRRGQTERTRLWGVALLTVRARPTPRCLDRAAVRLRVAGLRRAACPAEPMVLAALERTGLEPVTERTALPSFA